MSRYDPVGKRFRAFGCLYLCTRTDPDNVYVRLEVACEGPLFPDPKRKVGDEVALSWRALGCTYHEVRERMAEFERQAISVDTLEPDKEPDK